MRKLLAALCAIAFMMVAADAQQITTAPSILAGLNKNSTPSTTSISPTNLNCGTDYYSGGAGGTLTITLPAAPVPGCTFGFDPSANAISINPNGISLYIGSIGVTTGTVSIPALSGFQPPVIATYDGAGWTLSGNQNILSQISASQSALSANGQVYLSLSGSTLQLCPYNGPGWLIVNGRSRLVPPTCLFLPNTATTGSSVLNYIYVNQVGTNVSGTQSNAGLIELTVASTTGMQTGDRFCVYNVTGTTEANGCWIITLTDSTHITLQSSTYTNAWVSGGTVVGIGLLAATTGHVTSGGIEVESSSTSRTLVGMVYVAGSQTLNDSATKRDVASWYNPQPKKMIVQDTNGRTWAAGTAGTFITASSVIEGEFVVFGPQATPGTYPINSVRWSIGASEKQTISDSCGLSASFNTAAQSGAAGVTAEAEWNGFTEFVSSDYVPVSVSGMATGLTEGRIFMDMAGWATTATCTLNTQSPGVYIEAIVRQ